MKFHEYNYRRLVEDSGLDINQIQSMILKALGGNPDSKAYDVELSSFASGEELLHRLYSLNGLKRLIDNNPASLDAISKAAQSKLTIGNLAGILLSAVPKDEEQS